ncbi:MAG: hypothetical protein ACI4IQ_00930, partial [Eubacterium sp.]
MEYFSVVHYTQNNTPSAEARISDNSQITVKEAKSKAEYSGLKTRAVLTVNKNQAEKSALRFVVEAADWDTDNYVFAPSALYNGNRFQSLCREYPPMLTKEEAEKSGGETIISDVPRLDKGGNGCVQLNAGDLSFPCIGYYSNKSKSGYLLFFEQKNELGNLGITIQKNAEDKSARLILSSPCVRTPYKYAMCTTSQKSDDSAAILKSGDTVTFSFTQYRFDCDSVCEFINTFFKLRQIQGLPK